jgi:hypothetical protein
MYLITDKHNSGCERREIMGRKGRNQKQGLLMELTSFRVVYGAFEGGISKLPLCPKHSDSSSKSCSTTARKALSDCGKFL